MSDLQPKIYVACLAAYNDGYLHGAWLDADQDIDSLHECIQKILLTSPMVGVGEYAIHDYEDFGELSIHEYDSLEKISSWARFIVEHGKLGTALLDYLSGDIDRATTMIEECYHGDHRSRADFVEDFLEETGTEIPEHLHFYIDYQAMARDWFISDFLSLDVDNEVHVFSQY